MSRGQNFTSMAAWPKSKSLSGSPDNQESASGGPTVLGLVDKTVCTRQPLVLLVWDIETGRPDELHG